MLEANTDAVKYHLSIRGRSRYIVTSITGDWYVGLDSQNTLHKYKCIDYAKAYYSINKAIVLYQRCTEMGWKCEIVKYDTVYTPIEVKEYTTIHKEDL